MINLSNISFINSPDYNSYYNIVVNIIKYNLYIILISAIIGWFAHIFIRRYLLISHPDKKRNINEWCDIIISMCFILIILVIIVIFKTSFIFY